MLPARVALQGPMSDIVLGLASDDIGHVPGAHFEHDSRLSEYHRISLVHLS